ncbi:uncharacterized protein LOC112043028 isoform X2 [Bicyclus anynana]|uniref:Uncharacterized protein LOC112043028 isoform X2 n=1 Tax=Bicyclus anynana TaxID=110368 RepID=A0A6J1MI89_BICAN|nr:uncharacterized protein LOC112043028 isoform X2 [Bicyclus anynana]
MPLTQEKRLDNNFSNNNDHSYLHKKFKKMASTMSMLPGSSIKGEESGRQGTSLLQVTSSSTITNGSISAAHPEIEKIKDIIYDKRSFDVEKNVQTNFNEENFRLNDVNNFVQIPGKTSFSEEFLNKTENLENDFIKETYSGGAGRYICPYCKISCAKPSVLQKHIRAHTNERPYPCIPCGFAFKTKSNLYKHRRSRTHALRLQGADIATAINDDDLSGDSESDTSIPPTSLSGSDRDQSSDTSMIRSEKRPNEFSSPELTNDCNNILLHSISSLNDNNKSKAIYKPKFRAAFYHGMDDKDKIKKTISQNTDFLTHISKIISDNEAIVDVIETPLQKKYGKIKQIAESKQFLNDIEITADQTPLNLTKSSYDTDNLMRKRSHSDSFAQIVDDQKHPLNPEGSIIKDLLLKTKANGLNPVTSELVDGLGPLYVCSLCQIVYRSADNLEIHRLYYCKGALSNNPPIVNNAQKELKSGRPENVFVRSNSINVRFPDNVMTPVSRVNISAQSPPIKHKPDNIVILKADSNDVIAPLPSPGPLLGNTRLVDTRIPSEFNKKTETLKIRPKESSPKRRLDSRSETYSPRLLDNLSPRSADLYSQPKMRCMEINTPLRPMEEMSPHVRHNSTSLQMFGGEVKIVDHSGSTTTLRIEPSKTQLSPILIHQNLSPSKYAIDSEASSVVVRSGLHSGGTIVHNPPTPKDTISTAQIQTSRISVSTPTAQNSNLLNIHDITHFQFPPLSAITAYNPLTLPPLSPSSSPNGATTIFHGGKMIPHVPGIPGPNTPGLLVGNNSTQIKNVCLKNVKSENILDSVSLNMQTGKGSTSYDRVFNSKSPNTKQSHYDIERHKQNKDNYNSELQTLSTVPVIKIKHVDEPIVSTPYPANNNVKVAVRFEGATKRNAEGFPRMPVLKENSNYLLIKKKIKDPNIPIPKNVDSKSETEMKNFNFENLITKVEIYNNQIQSSSEVQKNCTTTETCATSLQNERSETSYFQKNLAAKSLNDERKPKFLRPSTLPLKPGTFTPKKHHGITPNANTMPLISPETPRPAKAYGQLYLNGNAYTYLGLKCSTKVFYCTINRPQPTYVPNQHFLSMYSNWQLLSELTPDPLGLSASSAMSLYDSRHRPQNVAVSVIKQDLILTHSSQWNKNSKDNKQSIPFMDSNKSEELRNIAENIATSKKELTGGFESNEEYTYVRGRGRGRYVCSECGIRCKKPSMLKKHIRTHTDVRPYTCVHCVFRHFSFKTKGNLTKHMKSKAHYKKCSELGINPNDGNDVEGIEMAQCSGETDDDTDSEGDEGNEGETESSDTEICKSRLPEHEAAHCLLSLGGCRPATSATPGLITSARPSTYPYTPIMLDSEADNSTEKLQAVRTPISDSIMDVDNEPMDLSKNEIRPPNTVPEIPTARESSVLASLASNTAKLPQHHSQWVNGEPMLHTYLTERALLDSKIKQSQQTCNPKTRKIDLENSMFPNKDFEKSQKKNLNTSLVKISASATANRVTKENNIIGDVPFNSTMTINTITTARTPTNLHLENSNYMKHAQITLLKTLDNPLDRHSDIPNDDNNGSNIFLEEKARSDDSADVNEIKRPPSEYDSAGTIAITEGADFESTSYSTEKLMDENQRVCYFCNETFTKPPRPFRCTICAVSFRTKGHLLVHERSTSHNIKISMAPNSENAKHVVSEYLKHSRINSISLDDSVQNHADLSSDEGDGSKISMEEKTKIDDNMDDDGIKLSEYEPLRSKDLTERIDLDNEDGWKDCDFCNKMFKESAQLKLHLNIHYMEKPFRCSVCDVTYRAKGYLQKNVRSTYNNNKTTKKPNSENAKYVVSEYLKHARINPIKSLDDSLQNHPDVSSDELNSNKVPLDEKSRVEDNSESDGIKLPSPEYDSVAPKVVIGVGGVAFKVTKGKEFEGSSYSPGKLMEDGRRVCDFCNKTFTKPSQLRLHLNIHYMERPFRCSICAVSFRTRGHLQKHERSASHHNKVSMTSTFGAATSFNPRPFRCSDCNIAFRIHGHLAKHLRSKMHVMRLECLFKLPFGTFTEIERAGLSLTDIDTTDCASSLASLQSLARKLHEKDPTKLEYREPSGSLPTLPATSRDSSEEDDSGVISEKTCDSVNDSEFKTIENDKGHDTELRVNYSATDN